MECPTCGRRDAVYSRRLTKSMVKGLRILRDATEDGSWAHWDSLYRRGGDNAKARYWGLARPRDLGDGYWRITAYGRKFLDGEVKVPRTIYLYRREITGFDGPDVSVDDIE